MADFTDPSGARLRLSHDERERAVAALRAHAAQGRLSDEELGSRERAARAAVTRGDLAPLFADLPGALNLDDEGATAPGAAAPGAQSPGPAAPYPYLQQAYEQTPPGAPAPQPAGSPSLLGRWGVLIVSVMPFAAVLLFFLTGMAWGYQFSWLWFLLIPLAGALVYGVDGGRRR